MEKRTTTWELDDWFDLSDKAPSEMLKRLMKEALAAKAKKIVFGVATGGNTEAWFYGLPKPVYVSSPLVLPGTNKWSYQIRPYLLERFWSSPTAKLPVVKFPRNAKSRQAFLRYDGKSYLVTIWKRKVTINLTAVN